MDQRRARLLRALALALLCVGTAAAAYYLTRTPISAADVSAWVAPHRHAWYALPMIMLGFIVLGLVPVVLLIAATGIAFGPVLGPLYAMAGCLASASAAFAVGRWLGRGPIERWGGPRVARLTQALARNGTLAVFLVRKVPAPFVLVNVVIGASAIRYREFVIGTALGMGAFVIALAGFGYQLTELWRHPSPLGVLRASLFLAIPLTAAWSINRLLRRRYDERRGA
jgi:phospholipase D1/2